MLCTATSLALRPPPCKHCCRFANAALRLPTAQHCAAYCLFDLPYYLQVRQRLVATRRRMEELLSGHVPDSDAGQRTAFCDCLRRLRLELGWVCAARAGGLHAEACAAALTLFNGVACALQSGTRRRSSCWSRCWRSTGPCGNAAAASSQRVSCALHAVRRLRQQGCAVSLCQLSAVLSCLLAVCCAGLTAVPLAVPLQSPVSAPCPRATCAGPPAPPALPAASLSAP